MADHKSPEQLAWESKVLAPTLAKAPERKREFTDESGLPIPRVALPPDGDEIDARLGFPGQFPFTRGIQPTMYRGRLWTMRQYAGFSTAEESNARYRYLLSQGTTGLSVAFDLPTQLGLDSDHPMSLGEVGRVGVAIDTLADVETLFGGIPLDKVSTSMTINAPAAVLLAMYVAVARKQGVAPGQLNGTIQNDVLKEYAARGTYIFPPRPSLRLTTDIFAWCQKEMPRFNTISISGYHIREAGSSAVEEVAFTLADAIAYVEAAIGAGLSVDAFAPQLAFFFNCTSDLFGEVAKFRAARRLWARLMRDRFGASSPKSQMLRFHTQTAGHTLTAQQSENNVVRVALQALAAVLGGTQSLHTNSRDEALGLPSEASVRTALRTQQIIAFETGAADSVDPLGGSYLVEEMTDRIESEAAALIEQIDEMGGMVAAIEAGFVQRRIEESAYKVQCAIERGEKIIVGVNKFAIEETERPAVFRVDPGVEKSQIDRLRAVREQRDTALVTTCLDRLENAARGSDNLMPLILDAVSAYASLGEICDRLRRVFGEFKGG
ncbi:MAG: methylmalonyl-CoA mutase family protein [Myxococcales bacterium]|jgi:methylmalonyl-CoA mutase N-terminal domain/subunit|nr:methylmalonyl-CoA mutase family protein [Myxococcales bacterium]